VPDERQQAHPLDDPLQPARRFRLRQRRELRDGGLQRRHLAEVDEAGMCRDRPREEGRARARRADDEDRPATRAEAAGAPLQDVAARARVEDRRRDDLGERDQRGRFSGSGMSWGAFGS
jgi:hypothetical protein